MQNLNIENKTASFGLALSIAIIATSLLVIIKETSQPVHDLMVSLTGHHWVTHSVATIIVYLLLGASMSRLNMVKNLAATPNKLTQIIVGSTIIGGMMIGLFFLLA